MCLIELLSEVGSSGSEVGSSSFSDSPPSSSALFFSRIPCFFLRRSSLHNWHSKVFPLEGFSSKVFPEFFGQVFSAVLNFKVQDLSPLANRHQASP